jgi:hypothetical protein
MYSIVKTIVNSHSSAHSQTLLPMTLSVITATTEIPISTKRTTSNSRPLHVSASKMIS